MTSGFTKNGELERYEQSTPNEGCGNLAPHQTKTTEIVLETLTSSKEWTLVETEQKQRNQLAFRQEEWTALSKAIQHYSQPTLGEDRSNRQTLKNHLCGAEKVGSFYLVLETTD